jgi:hypothetical protein
MPPRRARVLLGAAAKVGKTSLLGNWAPQTTLLVDTHNGTLLLDGEHYVSHVKDWPSFVSVIDDVCKGGHNFHTIGLDLAGDLWRFCDLYHGRIKDGLRLPASAMDDYGRSSTKARTAFMTQIGRLLAAPVGIWFLTHLREKTNKEGELVVYAPDMDKAVHGYVMGAVDFVWLAEVVQGGRRVVHTQPTPHFEAGSRKQLPSPLPMDAGEIARALDRALNPQDYDESGERRKPEAAPEPVAATPEVEARQVPSEPRDVERTGESDVPAVVDETVTAVQGEIFTIGNAKAAEILCKSDDAGVEREALRKSVQWAMGLSDLDVDFADDAAAIEFLAGAIEQDYGRTLKWIAKQQAKATA